MMFRIAGAVLLLIALAGTDAVAAPAEAIVGTWTLSTQIIDGKSVDVDPLTLRIYPTGSSYEFAYSVPVNGVHLVSLKFTAIYLDGKEGPIKNVRGETVGAASITKSAPLEYKTLIKGANRPTVAGKITISADNKTLTSESDAQGGGGPTHTVQVFSRH